MALKKEESKDTPIPNVWVGSRTGLLKSVYFQNKTAKNHFEETKYGKEFEILSMCWNCKEKSKINLGLKSGVVKTYDPKSNKFDEACSIPGLDGEKDGTLYSLQKMEETFVSGMDMGKVVSWSSEQESFETISCGDSLTSMATLPESNRLATGGKETPMKVWDLNKAEKPVFIAKNVRPDWKQLRVPVWVTSICFVDNSPTKILTTTGYSHIRIYDLNSRQRRPVLETTFDEYPITTSSMVDRAPNMLYVANTQGSMASFDIRKLKNVYRCYKGSFGSVRHVINHPTLPYLFSCGLDRYLRVHNENDGTLAHKVHLKSQLNCLLVTETALAKKSSDDVVEDVKHLDKAGDAKDDEESVWNDMPKVDDSDEEVDIQKSKKRRLKK